MYWKDKYSENDHPTPNNLPVQEILSKSQEHSLYT